MAFAFRPRSDGAVACRLDDEERAVIAQVAQEVHDLIRLDLGMEEEPDAVLSAADSEDPLQRLEAEFATAEPRRPRDAAVQRLFPDASDDESLAEELRRFGQSDLADQKLEDLRILMQTLDATGHGTHEVLVRAEQVLPWLRALTMLRLVLADRLGVQRDGDFETLAMLQEIEERVPEAEPSASADGTAGPDLVMAVYELLSWLQESLLRALNT